MYRDKVSKAELDKAQELHRTKNFSSDWLGSQKTLKSKMVDVVYNICSLKPEERRR